MKPFILIILLMASIRIYSQDSVITYTEVVQIPGATKDQLFTKARQWFNDNFRSSKDVIQVSDKESGELLGKCYLASYYKFKSFGKLNTWPISYFTKIALYVKDGRYKYEFTEFYSDKEESIEKDMGVLTTAAKGLAKNPYIKQKKLDDMWASMKQGLDTTMNVIIAGLKNKMSSSKAPTDF